MARTLLYVECMMWGKIIAINSAIYFMFLFPKRLVGKTPLHDMALEQLLDGSDS